MFTGIVTGTGEVVKVEAGTEGGLRMWITTDVLGPRRIGASVAVDGVCLTVTSDEGGTCAFDVVAETLARSTLSAKTEGDLVNLEAPLRAGDELGGHIVQGHVDAVARLIDRRATEDGVRFGFEAGPEAARYVVEKGSVTVDGVSLTVSDVGEAGFAVAVVPHTLEVTTFGTFEVGREVNIELDVIGKYVERLVAPWRRSEPDRDVAPDPLGRAADPADPESSRYL